MNMEADEYLICEKDGGIMIAIGEEIVDNWESIYIYECLKCHNIVRTTCKYLKSFKNPKKEKIKVILI